MADNIFELIESTEFKPYVALRNSNYVDWNGIPSVSGELIPDSSIPLSKLDLSETPLDLGTNIIYGYESDTNRIIDANNVKKQARFDCGDLTAGTLRTFTFPDLSGILALTEGVQCFKNKYLVAPIWHVTDCTETYGVQVVCPAGLGADVVATLPSTTGIIGTTADIATHAASVTSVHGYDASSNLCLPDSKSLILGTGSDATIQYDGTDLVINPQAVGSGVVKISCAAPILRLNDIDDSKTVELYRDAEISGIRADTLSVGAEVENSYGGDVIDRASNTDAGYTEIGLTNLIGSAGTIKKFDCYVLSTGGGTFKLKIFRDLGDNKWTYVGESQAHTLAGGLHTDLAVTPNITGVLPNDIIGVYSADGFIEATRGSGEQGFYHVGDCTSTKTKGTDGWGASWLAIIMSIKVYVTASTEGSWALRNFFRVYNGVGAGADGKVDIGNGATEIFLNGTQLTSTTTELNYLDGVTTPTGTGALVLATSPTLVTPTLGVASATSINKVAITAPATSATLTIANGKTLTCNDNTTLATNSITFAGTEVLTLAATKNVTFADAFITSGAFSLTLTTTAATNVTLPTSGTLMANPMSHLGALIYGGASGVPTELLNPGDTSFLCSSTTGGSEVRWRSGSAARTDIGLGNVTNESKATMFTDPTFTGTASGTFSGNITGNVTGNCSGSSGSCTGNAATVTNATFTTALIVQTGAVTLTGNAAGGSTLVLPAGSSTLANYINSSTALTGIAYAFTTTWTDMDATTYTITLPSAGTFLIYANLRLSHTGTATHWGGIRLFDHTDNAVVANSNRFMIYAAFTGALQYSSSAIWVVTVDSADIIHLQAYATANSVIATVTDANGLNEFGYVKLA